MIDPTKYGVSFSIKQCRSLGIDPDKTLSWLLRQGFRRFRLMSYWDEVQKNPSDYDFTELDRQIKLITKRGGEIALCVGLRQPRWPENHWAGWAWNLQPSKQKDALLTYIHAVVSRYKNEAGITSWQLENEALNRNFGERGDFDRQRLRTEYQLVKRLDPSRPIIMTTSNSWGLPFRQPIPDSIGFSLYRTMNLSGKQTSSKLPIWSYRLRAGLARILLRRPSFLHELQVEPWGPKAIWEMTREEQDQSMGTVQIKTNIQLAKTTKLYPIDLWGAEWWFWRKQQGDNAPWKAVNALIKD